MCSPSFFTPLNFSRFSESQKKLDLKKGHTGFLIDRTEKSRNKNQNTSVEKQK
jgi:hypothetical protein